MSHEIAPCGRWTAGGMKARKGGIQPRETGERSHMRGREKKCSEEGARRVEAEEGEGSGRVYERNVPQHVHGHIGTNSGLTFRRQAGQTYDFG